MYSEARAPDNRCTVLIDYVSSFAPLIDLQRIAKNVVGGRALAQTALTFGVPLIVSVGPVNDPSGVLYPEIADVLGAGNVQELLSQLPTQDLDGDESA